MVELETVPLSFKTAKILTRAVRTEKQVNLQCYIVINNYLFFLVSLGTSRLSGIEVLLLSSLKYLHKTDISLQRKYEM